MKQGSSDQENIVSRKRKSASKQQQSDEGIGKQQPTKQKKKNLTSPQSDRIWRQCYKSDK